MNPFADGTGLTLNISEDDNSLDLEVARSVISYFRVSKTRADTIIKDVHNAVRNWRTIAGKFGLSKREQYLMEGAFLG